MASITDTERAPQTETLKIYINKTNTLPSYHLIAKLCKVVHGIWLYNAYVLFVWWCVFLCKPSYQALSLFLAVVADCTRYIIYFQTGIWCSKSEVKTIWRQTERNRRLLCSKQVRSINVFRCETAWCFIILFIINL